MPLGRDVKSQYSLHWSPPESSAKTIQLFSQAGSSTTGTEGGGRGGGT